MVILRAWPCGLPNSVNAIYKIAYLAQPQVLCIHGLVIPHPLEVRTKAYSIHVSHLDVAVTRESEDRAGSATQRGPLWDSNFIGPKILSSPGYLGCPPRILQRQIRKDEYIHRESLGPDD